MPYEAWRATCDTLHAHTQVLGKLAVALAPPNRSSSTLRSASPRVDGRRCRSPHPITPARWSRRSISATIAP